MRIIDSYMKHMGSCLANLPVQAVIDDDARSVTIRAPRFDSALLAGFVEQVLPRHGVRAAFRDDNDPRRTPPEAQWSMVFVLGDTHLHLYAVKLGSWVGGQMALVLSTNPC
ncbi:hypothetical protein [Niveibacterium sp.]|uniref:hypothetical protein n=1 Tax=Niveibacterium sp. TaxID=2017444 RepID=UPI0035B1D725